MAEQCIAEGRFNAAIEAYLEVLQINPSDGTTRKKVADLCVKVGRLSEAIAHIKLLAEPFRKDGFLMQVAALLKWAMRLDPANIEIVYDLAECYYQFRCYKDAIHALRECAEELTRRGELTLAREMQEQALIIEAKLPS